MRLRHIQRGGGVVPAAAPGAAQPAARPCGRGLHSSTFQLNLSRFCHWLSDTKHRVSRKLLTLSLEMWTNVSPCHEASSGDTNYWEMAAAVVGLYDLCLPRHSTLMYHEP